LQWTKDESGLSFTSIPGMDPRADWLLGPGFEEFQPAGPEALIPFILWVQSQDALEFINRFLRAGPGGDQGGPPAYPVSLYRHPGVGLRAGDYVTLLAPRSFFEELAKPDGNFQTLRAARKQIQLCLPVSGPSMPDWRPGTPLPLISNPGIGPPQGGWPPGTVVVGIIDDAITFAHERFRTANGQSRVECFWQQDGEPWSPTVDRGRETLKADIDTFLSQSTHAGSVDEEEVYRRSGLIDFSRSGYKSAAWRLAHGTHVLDLAAGFDPSAARTDRPIIAVQLPAAATAAQSGAGLEDRVQDAIKYIQDRALTLSGSGPALPVAINFSYGTGAGPHDGTSLIEQSVDTAAAAAQPTTRIVLPAGNSHLARGHQEIAFQRLQDIASLRWRVQPDDATVSILQIWLPHAGAVPSTASRVRLSIVTPDGLASPLLDEVNGWGLVLKRNGEVVCEARYSFQPTPTERGVFAIELQPTVMLLPTSPASHADRVAPSGVWTIRLHNALLGPQDRVHAWIERDDLIHPYPRRGRQSYFDETCYRRFDAQGRVVEEDAAQPACSVKRAGMINAIATGERAVVTGGFLRKELGIAPYSAGGPTTPPRGGPLNPATRKPDAALVSDDSEVHSGVLAAGSRSGSVVAMRGTSVAAPQLTRWIADELAAGRPADRAAVKAFAILADATLPPPPPPPERGGWGRIETAWTMRGPRTRYWR
jgi:hypothetical protein